MDKGFALRKVIVKNTFVEDDDLFDDDTVSMDAIEEAVCMEKARRQVSEPVGFMASPGDMAMHATTRKAIPKGMASSTGYILNEEKAVVDFSWDPLRTEQEPEQEKDPSTDKAEDDKGNSFGSGADDPWQVSCISGDAFRQVTADIWPTWHDTTDVDQQAIRSPQQVMHGTQPAVGAVLASLVTDPYSPLHPCHAADPASGSNSMLSQLPPAAASISIDASLPVAANAKAAADSDTCGDAKGTVSWDKVQTVMVRNLPNKVSQQMLLSELDSIGFQHAYDFVYLPIDPATNANKGYAFINFIDSSYASLFRKRFHGAKFSNVNSEKVLSILPATLQGFDANYIHYSTARVKHRAPHARPLFLRQPENGSMLDMPNRSGKVAAPLSRSAVQSAVQSATEKPKPSKSTAPDAMARAFRGTSEKTSDEQAHVPPKPKFCSQCGEALTAGLNHRFCEFCGSPLRFDV